jgi:hypothetical protein
MTFAQRQINLQFSDDQGTVELDGLRCAAIISAAGGYSSAARLQLRVFGMSLDQMNRYSSTGTDMVRTQNDSIIVMAGNVGGAMSQVFAGTIVKSFPDFSAAPDVSFNCTATSGFFYRAAPAAPNSYQGAQNAEDIIQKLASSIGFVYENPNGAHAVLQNQYLSGSVIQQIDTVIQAASFGSEIANNTVTIWPNDGTRDDTVIAVGPNSIPPMVGYPSFWEAGVIVKSEFNPNIANGRTIAVTSSIPKAKGSWPIHTVTHELSSVTPDGPWFTTARLNPSPFVPVN